MEGFQRFPTAGRSVKMKNRNSLWLMQFQDGLAVTKAVSGKYRDGVSDSKILKPEWAVWPWKQSM